MSTVLTVSQLVHRKACLYKNQIKEDKCPVCWTHWTEFIEPDTTVVCVLTCNHGFCVKCLATVKTKHDDSERRNQLINSRNNEAARSTVVPSHAAAEAVNQPDEEADEEEEEDVLLYSCPVCRKNLASNLLEDVAYTVASSNIIKSVGELSAKLPLTKQERESLVAKILLNDCRFDVNKLKNILFNTIGLMSRDVSKSLTSDEKQIIYEQARAPVKKLQQEYSELKQKLQNIADSESQEWRKMNQMLAQLENRLQNAQINAAKDIYEQTNAFGNMGVEIEDEDTPILIDLHGLEVSEAKIIVDEYVVPILNIYKVVMVITGRGVHCQSGVSRLKEEMRRHFTEKLKLKCENVVGNEGVLSISIPQKTQ
jgi:DNA-nicking Smr family endonuclease